MHQVLAFTGPKTCRIFSRQLISCIRGAIFGRVRGVVGGVRRDLSIIGVYCASWPARGVDHGAGMLRVGHFALGSSVQKKEPMIFIIAARTLVGLSLIVGGQGNHRAGVVPLPGHFGALEDGLGRCGITAGGFRGIEVAAG